MSQYSELDKQIIKAIEARRNPLYNPHVCEEARRIATATGREEFRVTDGRLQALRKAGKIEYRHKTDTEGNGWRVVTPNAGSNGPSGVAAKVRVD